MQKITIKFPRGTFCEVEDSIRCSLKQSLILECDGTLFDGKILIISATMEGDEDNGPADSEP